MGAKVSNLEAWATSGILYEKTDILLAVKKVNEKWKGIVEEWMDAVPGKVIAELKY
jgi:hypothetical protein